MKIITLFLAGFILITTNACAQDNPMQAFETLADATWVSEGIQLGGFEGRTEYQMRWDLNKKIVRVNSYSTDPKTKEFGFRAVGIRAYNQETDRLEFYEFDKFGAVTEGTIVADGRNLHFEYEYQGSFLRDSWIYVSDDEFTFIVGIWEEGDWTRKFHETSFVKVKN